MRDPASAGFFFAREGPIEIATQSSRSLHSPITLHMIRKLSLFALLIVAACDAEHAGLTSAQQVYEVAMNEHLQDPVREIVILSDTEAQAIAG
jgi:hypothetical protein